MLSALLGRAQPVIPPNLYVNEYNSLGSPGNSQLCIVHDFYDNLLHDYAMLYKLVIGTYQRVMAYAKCFIKLLSFSI